MRDARAGVNSKHYYKTHPHSNTNNANSLLFMCPAAGVSKPYNNNQCCATQQEAGTKYHYGTTNKHTTTKQEPGLPTAQSSSSRHVVGLATRHHHSLSRKLTRTEPFSISCYKQPHSSSPPHPIRFVHPDRATGTCHTSHK
eukprot:GHVQ01015470.1.p1 GENE.GHVQ01015470.1~~GHVQ01015470.1.p1  ORF type:complete len:141 (-),score=26.77 GHVQ01015470.1:382-804(-)